MESNLHPFMCDGYANLMTLMLANAQMCLNPMAQLMLSAMQDSQQKSKMIDVAKQSAQAIRSYHANRLNRAPADL